MGIFNGYKRRKLEMEILKAKAQALDIEAREQQAETRRRRKDALDMKKEIELIHLQAEREQAQAELEDLRADLLGDDEQDGLNIDNMLETFLLSKLGITTPEALLNSLGNQAASPPPLVSSPTPPLEAAEQDFSNIDGLIASFPKDTLRKAAKLKESDLMQLIKGQAPNLTPEEIEYAIVQIKTIK